jgi:hypothetical protein
MAHSFGRYRLHYAQMIPRSHCISANPEQSDPLELVCNLHVLRIVMSTCFVSVAGHPEPTDQHILASLSMILCVELWL